MPNTLIPFCCADSKMRLMHCTPHTSYTRSEPESAKNISHLHGLSLPGLHNRHLVPLHTAAAGTPLLAERSSAHTAEKMQIYNFKPVDGKRHWNSSITSRFSQFLSVLVHTLPPSMLWYFFSRHFLTLASSLYVIKMKPLLFFDLGSMGSSMVSIWKKEEECTA